MLIRKLIRQPRVSIKPGRFQIGPVLLLFARPNGTSVIYGRLIDIHGASFVRDKLKQYVVRGRKS